MNLRVLTLWMLCGMICATIAVAALFVHRERGRGTAPGAYALGAWHEVRVSVPRSWTRVDSSYADGAMWRSPDASATVALGAQHASDADLAVLASAAEQALAPHLPGFDRGSITRSQVNGDPVVRAAFSAAAAHGRRVQIVQIWRRAHGTDLVATWTHAGSAPLGGLPAPSLASAGTQT